jgi:hypothetical protein
MFLQNAKMLISENKLKHSQNAGNAISDTLAKTMLGGHAPGPLAHSGLMALDGKIHSFS